MLHTKREVIDALKGNSQKFVDSIGKLNETDFENEPNGKWSAGQHLEHLVKSIKPLNFALSLPGFVPGLLFGKAKKASRTYDEIKQFYQGKLSDGAKASGAYLPKKVSFYYKEKLSNTLVNEAEKLAEKLEAKSEAELDSIVLPHPILGKLTLREMLFFTIYHTEHHTKSVSN
jgi:hypothetical protein